MAKNVLQKKRRIAHNKSVFDDCLLEGEGVLPACRDYVSTIIDDMDNNFKSMHSYTLNAKSSESKMKSTQNNSDENIVTPSTSQNHTQSTNFLKSKKYGLVRKFPLMEKSQKALQHIRHNRRIPKPRAHLASIQDDLLMENDPVYDKSGASVEKTKRNKQRNKNLKKNHAVPQNKSSFKTLPNVIASCLGKELRPSTSKKSKEENRKAPSENVELHSVKRNSNFKGSSVDNLDDNINVTSDSSNDNTTDSEYERFVQKNKKGLRKKCNKQKISTQKKVSKQSSRKGNKNTVPEGTLKSLPSEHTVDLSDEASTSSQTYRRKSKRIKVCNKVSDETESSAPVDSSNSESETDVFDGEIYTRDSSSEHAADLSYEASTSFQTYRRKSKRIKACHEVSDEQKSSAPAYSKNSESETDIFGGEIYSRDSSSESDITKNETFRNSTRNTQVTEQKDSEFSLTSEMHSVPDKDNAFDTYSSIANKPPTVSSEYNSFDMCSTAKIDLVTSTNSVERNNPSENPLIVDLISDNECENVSTPVISTTASSENQENCMITSVNKNESQLNSEESDIEIVDVVVCESSIKNVRCNLANNSPYCSNGFKNQFSIKTEKISSPFLVETEKFQNVLSKPKIECKGQEEKDSDDKYEAAYVTNICKEHNETNSKDSISEHSLSKDNLHDKTILNTEIKKEVCEDDDIILLDSDEISESPPFKIFSTSNLSFDQNKKSKDKTETHDIMLNSVVNNVNRIMESISEADSNSSSCQSLPNIQINKNTNVKNEKRFENLTGVKKEHLVGHSNSKTLGENNRLTEKELRLYEVACSNLKTQTETSNENIDKLLPSLKQPEMNNLSSADVKSLLQALKSEFETYQEILQTEATVEATFKLLEARQAEKLLSLKSFLQTCVKNNVCKDDSSTNIKKEMDLLFVCPEKTLTNEHEVASTCVKSNSDFEKTHSQGDPNIVCTPDALPQDFDVPFSAANIVPLSSIPERDIKPNLSELHNIPESVQGSSNTSSEMNTLTFGEKCSVCGKEAVAACQRCAKVFFCSNECGKKYWKDGHEKECGK